MTAKERQILQDKLKAFREACANFTSRLEIIAQINTVGEKHPECKDKDPNKDSGS